MVLRTLCKPLIAVAVLMAMSLMSGVQAQDTNSSGLAQSFIRALDPNSQSGQMVRGLLRSFVSPSGQGSTPENGTNRSGLPFSPMQTLSPAESGNPITSVAIPDLSNRERSLIGMHDVVLLVDKSGSMKESDCPAGIVNAMGSFFFNRSMTQTISRWQWSQQQISYLSQQVSPVLRNGITLVLFSSGQTIYNDVNADDISRIFSANAPGGGTNLARALKTQLDQYFRRRESLGGQVKPLSITVMTDGVPDNAGAVKSLIIDASRKISSPSEISINFLQIGTDSQGTQLLQELDNDLVSEGAAYDIVSSRSFPELVRKGLPRAIVEAISSPVTAGMR